MTAEDMLRIYSDLLAQHVQVWIDGGWCVDALLGAQTRPHSDVDIAVERRDVPTLTTLFSDCGYREEKRDDSTAWNFVLKDPHDKTVDIHVFQFDDQGNNLYGIPYPYDSLTGEGTIGGCTVKCISPEWMFRFKTAYQPTEKDLHDVRKLSDKFGFAIPVTHLR
ncbi:MAG: nucleotidyltransferase domain-containing protein [Ktedonobacterales bacterium]